MRGNMSEKYLKFKVQKKPLANSNLWKTNIKQCKMTCRFKLDMRPGTAESAVEINSTFDR